MTTTSTTTTARGAQDTLWDEEHKIRIFPPSGGKSNWRVRYYYPAGKRKECSANSAEAAEAKAREIQKLPSSGLGTSVLKKRKLPFRVVLDEYCDPANHRNWSGSTPQTVRGRVNTWLRPTLDEIPVHRVTWRECEYIVQKAISSGKAQSTIMDVYRLLGAVMKFARDWEYFPSDKDPMSKVAPPRAAKTTKQRRKIDSKKLPTRADIEALAAAMEKRHGRRYALAVWIAAWSGMRISEQLALKVHDLTYSDRGNWVLDEKHALIKVEKQYVEIKGGSEEERILEPKGSKMRETIFPRSLLPELQWLVEKVVKEMTPDEEGNVANPHGLLWPNYRGDYMRRTTWYDYFFRPAAAGRKK